MIIAISGTPGTGKTLVAKLLAKEIKAKLISISELAKKGKIPYTIDKKRKSKIIDENDLQKFINTEIDKHKKNVIEGHMSHFLVSDYVFVLRANPRTLETRLKGRKWSKNKIKENIEAEIIDEITIEAKKMHKNVFEIDTSSISVKETVDGIMKILKKHNHRKHPKFIDWTQDYANLLEN